MNLLAPDEVVLLAERLDEPRDLCALTATCAAFRAANVNLVWFHRCKESFREFRHVPEEGNPNLARVRWKLVYRDRDTPQVWYKEERPAWLAYVPFTSEYDWRAIARWARRAGARDAPPRWGELARAARATRASSEGDVWITAQLLHRGEPRAAGHALLERVARGGVLRLQWVVDVDAEEHDDGDEYRLVVDLSDAAGAARLLNGDPGDEQGHSILFAHTMVMVDAPSRGRDECRDAPSRGRDECRDESGGPGGGRGLDATLSCELLTQHRVPRLHLDLGDSSGRLRPLTDLADLFLRGDASKSA